MRRTGLLLAATALLMVALAGAALAATIDGDRRDNRLVGTERADTIRGLRGDDTVHGRGGADTLSGGVGDDTVRGAEGDDALLMRDGVAGNDIVRCGPGQDTARVDSRDEALGANADCEASVFRGEATGVLERIEIAPPENDPDNTHSVKDEASGGTYALKSGTVDLFAYEGRRVTVSGPVTARGAYGGQMDVERIEER
jgi:Ca2+-binding RTX toxin-like protein